MTLQADGKIVVAGRANGGSGDDFAVGRYNSDGTLDETFNENGKVITDFLENSDTAKAVAIQQDGKIVVAGYVYDSFDWNIAVALAIPVHTRFRLN